MQRLHVGEKQELRGGVHVRRRKNPSDTEADVDHHRPSLERENEMLVEENIRLLAKIKALEARLTPLPGRPDGVSFEGTTP